MDLNAKIQNKKEGETKRQKDQRNLRFVKSPGFQLFS